jgi:hypothetical protein
MKKIIASIITILIYLKGMFFQEKEKSFALTARYNMSEHMHETLNIDSERAAFLIRTTMGIHKESKEFLTPFKYICGEVKSIEELSYTMFMYGLNVNEIKHRQIEQNPVMKMAEKLGMGGNQGRTFSF